MAQMPHSLPIGACCAAWLRSSGQARAVIRKIASRQRRDEWTLIVMAVRYANRQYTRTAMVPVAPRVKCGRRHELSKRYTRAVDPPGRKTRIPAAGERQAASTHGTIGHPGCHGARIYGHDCATSAESAEPAGEAAGSVSEHYRGRSPTPVTQGLSSQRGRWTAGVEVEHAEPKVRLGRYRIANDLDGNEAVQYRYVGDDSSGIGRPLAGPTIDRVDRTVVFDRMRGTHNRCQQQRRREEDRAERPGVEVHRHGTTRYSIRLPVSTRTFDRTEQALPNAPRERGPIRVGLSAASRRTRSVVTPATAGVTTGNQLDCRVRGNDDVDSGGYTP